MSYSFPMIFLKLAQNIMINLMKWHLHSKINLNNNFLREKKKKIDISFNYINIQ